MHEKIAKNFELKSLLGNMSIETFIRDYWNQKPLFIKKAVKRSELPVNRLKFEQAIEKETSWNWSATKDLSDKVLYNRAHKGVPYIDHLKPKDIKTLRECGLYIVVNEIEKTNRNIASLLHSLESDLGVYSNQLLANLFQCGKSNGLALHNDPTDIFTLQLEGEKKWIVGNSPFPIKTVVIRYGDQGYFINSGPQEGEIISNEAAKQSFSEFIMESGDFLYLPPFTLHETKTLSDYTLSLNVLREESSVINFAYQALALNNSSSETNSFPLNFGANCSIKAVKKKLAREIEVLTNKISNESISIVENILIHGSQSPHIVHGHSPKKIETKKLNMNSSLTRNPLFTRYNVCSVEKSKTKKIIFIGTEVLEFVEKKWALVPNYLMENDTFSILDMMKSCKLNPKNDWGVVSTFFESLVALGIYRLIRIRSNTPQTNAKLKNSAQ